MLRDDVVGKTLCERRRCKGGDDAKVPRCSMMTCDTSVMHRAIRARRPYTYRRGSKSVPSETDRGARARAWRGRGTVERSSWFRRHGDRVSRRDDRDVRLSVHHGGQEGSRSRARARARRGARRSPRREPDWRLAAVHRRQIDGRPHRHAVASQGSAGPLRGLVFLGYPLHPPGRPEQRRDAHLPAIAEPMLFVQGTRMPSARAAEIQALLPRLQHATLHESPAAIIRSGFPAARRSRSRSSKTCSTLSPSGCDLRAAGLND